MWCLRGQEKNMAGNFCESLTRGDVILLPHMSSSANQMIRMH